MPGHFLSLSCILAKSYQSDLQWISVLSSSISTTTTLIQAPSIHIHLTSLASSHLFFFCFFFLFFNVYSLFERDGVWVGEGQRETETQNLKQAPGSELSAQSPMQARAMRSWPGWSQTLNLFRNQAGTLVEKPSSTRRSWWIRDLFYTGGLREDCFSKGVSPECKWGG